MDINNSSEDSERIILNNLTDEDGNIPYILTDEEDPYYLRGEPIYESNFADEIEKTRENTRQLLNNPEQSDIPYYFRGEQIYESNFADETETLEETRQLLNNLEQHLNNLFKAPILNQETQLGKKRQRKKSGRKTKDDKSTGKKHDKNYKDNMRIRLKIQFYNFIINFVNYVIKFRYDISNLIFRHLTHEEKQNTNLEYNKDIFQNKTIGDILQLDVSTKYNNKSNQNRINYLKILERIKKKENNDKFLELVDMNVATFYNSIYLTKNIPSILDYYCPNRKTKEKIPMFFTMFIDTLKNKESDEYINKIKDFGENFIEDFVRERNKKKKKKYN